MKSRIFNIMQYEKHPITGEVLMTEENIKSCIAHRSIKRWAYVCHDKDVYSAADEAEHPDYKAGEIKPRHWHLVLELKSNQMETYTIAKWLNIADNYVDAAKGTGAFLDCVKYLTHEDEKQQGLGKRLYSDDEVIANFDFRAELDKRAERRLRYGKDLDDKDMLRNEVLFHGMTLKQAREKYPLEYQNDIAYLEKCRLRYLEFAPMPLAKMNFYIEGAGGIGKGLISRAIARAIIDKDNVMDDGEIFFEVGDDGTTFEGYDGQPVLIWNDCRAITLLKKLGGRENVFNVFDPIPTAGKQNVKYGSIVLKNSINIVNSVQPWVEFLDGLAGEYKDKDDKVVRKKEDKSQSYRRFPFFLVLHENDYDLGINKGLFDGTREFEQYNMINGIRANFRKIAERCGDNMELVKVVNGKAVKIVSDKYIEMKEKIEHHQIGTDEEILEAFADVGTIGGGTGEV